MSLRGALLALLSAGPQTGYDVAKRFATSVGYVWNAPDSQIYPELRRLQAEGLLEGRRVPWGRRGRTKTEYTLTDAGADALRAWVDEPVAYAPVREPARLKAAYLEWASPGVAREHLLAHRDHHEGLRAEASAELGRLAARTSPVLVRRLASVSGDPDEIVAFKCLAYRNAVLRAEMEVAWAQEGLALLDALEAGRDAADALSVARGDRRAARATR